VVDSCKEWLKARKTKKSSHRNPKKLCGTALKASGSGIMGSRRGINDKKVTL